MKVLITGHRGYIGSKLFKKCTELQYDVRGIDIKEERDILNILTLEEFNNFKPDVIFHMAALPAVQYSVEHPSYTSKNNVLGTSTILEYAQKNNIKKVVFSSSSAIYGNNNFPVSPYGLHKYQSELECKLFSELYGMDIVCLRYFNVYSEDQIPTNSYPTVISAWMKKIRANEDPVIFGDGSHLRDYIHVEDIVDCNLFFANINKKFNGDCFDVGTGKNYSLNYIKDFILNKHKINFINEEARKSDSLSTLADISALKNMGWCARIDFEHGLEKCFSKENLYEVIRSSP